MPPQPLDGTSVEPAFVKSREEEDAASADSHGLRATSAALRDRVVAFLETNTDHELLQKVQAQTRASLDILDKALKQYKHDELALAWNGGKDCLVLLVLYLVAVHRHYADSSTFPTSLASIYTVPAEPFTIFDKFIHSAAHQYHLDLYSTSAPMKQAFAEYIEANPKIKGIFVGTRRTDPHSAELAHFTRTDRGWPDFMRIHPVIDWHYAEIWGFIRYFGIAYCPLYDMGYTSLGSSRDTYRNPALKVEDDEGNVTYRPAYELLADSAERLGRDK